jgi:diguanylate cyclase (GGDEF)-like protein
VVSPDWLMRREAGIRGARVDATREIAVPDDLSVLRTMLRISHAVLHATFFDEILEVVAEQALSALRASSVSISRWERDEHILRTLINVGDLQPGEQRWPESDDYDVSPDLSLTSLLQDGHPYVHAIDDLGVDEAVADYLIRTGKESEVAVPVMFDGAVWGEIWASGKSGRRFGSDDVQLLQAIAAYTAVGIGRGELFSTVWRHAHRDPLTDLPNRRALEAHFADIDWQATAPVLLLGDLDGFKDINDRDGHPAGDALLTSVAKALRDATVTADQALPVRLGGDEFCVLLHVGTLADAERLAHVINRNISTAHGPHITMTWGAAGAGPHIRSGAELMIAADGALIRAKAHGRGRFTTDATKAYTPPHRVSRRSTPHRGDSSSLITHVAEIVNAHRPLPVLSALEILALETQLITEAAGWAVSVTDPAGAHLTTYRSADSIRDLASGLSVIRDEEASGPYLLSEYPATAQAITTGTAFIAAVDLERSDKAETEQLTLLGYRAVLAAGATDAERGYLVEVFATADYDALLDVASSLQILVHFCVSAANTSLSSIGE